MLPTVQLFSLYWLKRKRFQTISDNFNWKIISEQHFALYSNIELLFLYFYTLGEGTVTASWIPWIRLLFIEDILLYSYHRRTVVIIGLYHISNRNIYIQWENTALFLKKKTFQSMKYLFTTFYLPESEQGVQHQNSLMRTWLNFQYSRKTTSLINHSGDT